MTQTFLSPASAVEISESVQSVGLSVCLHLGFLWHITVVWSASCTSVSIAVCSSVHSGKMTFVQRDCTVWGAEDASTLEHFHLEEGFALLPHLQECRLTTSNTSSLSKEGCRCRHDTAVSKAKNEHPGALSLSNINVSFPVCHCSWGQCHNSKNPSLKWDVSYKMRTTRKQTLSLSLPEPFPGKLGIHAQYELWCGNQRLNEIFIYE